MSDKVFSWILCILVVIGFVIILSATGAFAHDTWVNRGAYKNPAGEWCCGDYDCRSYSKTEEGQGGWVIDNAEIDPQAQLLNVPKGKEFVPYDEAMPIAPPDGKITICRRPDGSRRCVFGLKPGL